MKIKNFLHKGLKRLYLEDSAKGLPSDAVKKTPGYADFPAGHAKTRKNCGHFPCGKRTSLPEIVKGVWSLHVTRNWRLTFRIKDGEILDVDYEDYH